MPDYSPIAVELISCYRPAEPSHVVWNVTEHSIMQRLIARRITSEVIQTFSIKPIRGGWQYSTPNNGLRWKNADSQGTPKYRWLEGKSEPASALYYAFDLPEALQISGGACWLAGGEPDVWALRSAGVYHAISGFSETSVNPGLVEFLQSLGVNELHIAPDLDDTGKRWAGRVAKALEFSSIKHFCFRLPSDLGKGGDIGKLWQRYAKQPKQFERELLQMPQWYPESKVEKKKKPHIFDKNIYSEIPQDYKQRIANALVVESYNSNGWSNLVLCPFHDDHTPSAQLGDVGLKCHVCGFYNWNELGDRLGLGTLACYWHIFRHVETVTSVIVIGLSLETLGALITYGFTSAARVLYVLFSNGWEGGAIVTFKEIESICFYYGVKERAIREALHFTRGELPNNKKPKNEKAKLVLHKFSLLSFQHNTGKESAKLLTSTKIYRLPKRAEIAKALDIESETYYQIVHEALQSPKKFRAATYAAKIRQKPGQYTRKQLTKPLGISAPTSRAYDIIEGIEVTANWKKTTLTKAMIEAMPKTYQKLRIQRKEGAKYVQIEAVKRDGTSQLYSPCLESVVRAYDFAGDGGTVKKVVRLANTYLPKDTSKETGNFTKVDTLCAPQSGEVKRV